ncbi:hypothetical protein [Neisseria sp. S1]|uniref:hypothetical protein n=1 Tax=Neisseria sp. S1 TaxID=3318354 RepID=UPI003A8809C5
MDNDSLAAVAFAAVALIFGWQHFNRALVNNAIPALWRRIILGTATVIILLSLLYYLGWL